MLISVFWQGRMSAGDLLVYLAMISTFGTWLGGIVEYYSAVDEGSLALTDIREYLEHEDGAQKGNRDVAPSPTEAV